MALARPTTTKTLADATIESTLTVDQTTLTVDSSNDRVGVGTSTPSVQLEVQDTTTSSANTGGKLRLSANDGSPMGDSHRLGVLEFTGAEDSSNTQVVGARIEALTDAAWTNVENGCALYFYTTDGNASQSNVLKIDSNKKSTFNGVIDITDTTDASDDSGDTGALRVEGGASVAKKLYVGTDLQVTGDITLDDGGSLKEAGGTAAFTFDGSGHVTKIGQDSPSSGQFLKWDGSKAVWDAASGEVAGSVAADDISAGDAAINLTTTAGNITIDAQGNNTDIIFKGTDGGSDTTFLTIDGSAAGAATFNDKIVATELDISGDCDIDGTTNLDNTDIDGTLVVDGSNISLDSTSTLNIDNSDTSNGITIGTATSGVPISIGHTTSETTINDNLTVTGDLTVNGTTTTINSTTLTVDDKTVVIASGAADSSAADGAGISIDGASATLTYVHSGTKFAMNKPLDITGTITGDTSLTLDSTTITTAEIGVLDGVTAGTATASKAVVLDANKDIGTIRNLTIDGTFSDGNYTFDTSGNVTGLGNVTMTGDLTVSGGDIIYGNGQHATLDVADVSGTNTAGKNLTILAGASTGSGSGGSIIFQTADGGSSGSSVNSHATALTIEDDGKITAAGKLVVNNKLTVGVDDTGYDVQFFGATSGASFLWDESADDLILSGVAGLIVPDGQLTLGSTAIGATAAEINAACDASARSAAVVSVANDHFLFCDGGATGATKVESIADFLTLAVGTASNTGLGYDSGNIAVVDLHGVGVDGAANQLLLDAGDGTMDSRSDLTYNGSTLAVTGDMTLSGGDLTYGNGQAANLKIAATAHNAAGQALTVSGGTTTAGTTNDIAGGALTLAGGQGKGQGAGGSIVFQTAKAAGGAGSSLNSLTTRLTINHKGTVSFGNAQDAELGLDNTAHDTAGKSLTIFGGAPDAGTTNNIAGGDVVIEGGKGKGTGDGGDIEFKVYKAAGGAGSSYNSASTILKIKSNKSANFTGEVNVGVDDSGHDVKFYGATSGAYMLWDESEDDLIMGGAARIVVPDGQLILGSTALSSTASEIDAICDTGGRTAATVAVADDHFMFYDGGASGASKVESIADLVSGIASSGLKASNGTLSNNRCVMTAIDNNLTLTGDHNGRTIFVKEFAADKTITLPSPAAGYAVKIVYLHNNNTYDLIIKAAADTTFMYGLIGRLDFGGAGSGYHNSPNSYTGVTAATFIGGASHETNNTVTIVDALAGTSVEFYSDGTSWFLHGIMICSIPDSTATFSQGDY
tara:strand:+ start:854 stop:4645 length:3792 start_codon:yes stop_codon:yes gene_type:complete